MISVINQKIGEIALLFEVYQDVRNAVHTADINNMPSTRDRSVCEACQMTNMLSKSTDGHLNRPR